MSGRVVVIGMLLLIAAVMTVAWFWPEGREEVAAPEPAPVAQAEEPEDDSGYRVTRQDADGVVITNVPEGQVGRAEKAIAARDAARGDEPETPNPFAAFLEAGDSVSAQSTRFPNMSEMDPSNPEYDASIEARQRFFEYEADLLERSPLTPESWREVTSSHQDDLKEVFKRAKVLADDGHEREARKLIDEWSLLQNTYKAQAYGRGSLPARE